MPTDFCGHEPLYVAVQRFESVRIKIFIETSF